MRLGSWLRNLCLTVLADTLADLAGLLDEVRGEHERDREMLHGKEAMAGAIYAGDPPESRADSVVKSTPGEDRTAA